MLKIMFTLSILILPSFSVASEPEWTDYEYLLQRYVHAGEKNDTALNLVDYPALGANKAWPKLLARLADFDELQLRNKSEKLAFWINAYNILAIKVVLDHWPLQSIRDAGSFFSPVWKQPAGLVAGKIRTLNEVEHQILRQMAEPRIHFAIVCASVSCPDLRSTPYRAEQLNEQLQEQVKAFIAQPAKGVRIQGDNIHISKIFDWFENDFQALGGVMTFIKKYDNSIISTTQQPSYLDYDWSLNASTTLKSPG